MAMKLKLLVDKNSMQVMYGEAGKEFVDFLLGLMAVPLGTILRLLKHSGQTGSFSLAKLYNSVGELDPSCFQRSGLRNSILNPNSSSTSNVKQTSVLQGLLKSESSSLNLMSFNRHGSQNQDEIDGYVNGAVIYMVMDDLTITPSSTILSH